MHQEKPIVSDAMDLTVKQDYVCANLNEASRIILEGKSKEDIMKETVLNRFGTPEDQAKVALFLASSLSDHITGEAIIVSAGQFMRQ